MRLPEPIREGETIPAASVLGGRIDIDQSIVTSGRPMKGERREHDERDSREGADTCRVAWWSAAEPAPARRPLDVDRARAARRQRLGRDAGDAGSAARARPVQPVL